MQNGYLIKKDGFIIPMIVLAAISISFFVLTVYNLNQGFRTQIYNLKESEALFNIATTAYNRVIAMLFTKGWTNRPFKTTPYEELNVNCLDGKYHVFIENSPNKDKQFDIYIRVEYKKLSQVFLWRVKYNDHYLDHSEWVTPVIFLARKEVPFPPTEGSNYANKIDELLRLRSENNPKANAIVQEVLTVNSAEDVLNKITNQNVGATPISNAAEPTVINNQLPIVGLNDIPQTFNDNLPTPPPTEVTFTPDLTYEELTSQEFFDKYIKGKPSLEAQAVFGATFIGRPATPISKPEWLSQYPGELTKEMWDRHITDQWNCPEKRVRRELEKYQIHDYVFQIWVTNKCNANQFPPIGTPEFTAKLEEEIKKLRENGLTQEMIQMVEEAYREID